MIRAFAIFGCLIGFFVLLAFVSVPPGGDVEAHETAIGKSGCVTREVALDEGYGISRKISQLICDERN